MPRCFLRVTVLLCLICIVAACGGDQAAPATSIPVAASTVASRPAGGTYVVQRGRVVRALEFTGRVSPVEEVPLYFKTAGFVKQVFVRPGDRVKAGDLLAELEAEIEVESAQNQIALAELDLAVAQATLSQAEQANAYAVVQAEMTVELAQEQLALTRALKATYTTAAVVARVGLEQAEDQVSRAEVEYQEALNRFWEPPEHAEAYALALQQARWNLESAQAEYDRAISDEVGYQHQLEIAKVAVRQAEAELEQLEKGVDPVLRIQVDQAQRTLEWLKGAMQVVAPVDGEIISLSLHPGRPVEPFRTVVVVADTSSLEVSADLTGDQLEFLAEGQEATVFLGDDLDRGWAGIIRRLPYPYGTGGSVEGAVSIDNSTRIGLEEVLDELKLGDLVRVTIVLEETDDALWLPPDAIRTFQSSEFVIVQDDGQQRRVDVELGIQAQDQVEILRGLEEGQLVIVP